MSHQIQSMLKQGILERAEITPSYLSTFFLVPKPGGSFRPIFNLKCLNQFLEVKPFQLFSHFRVPTFLQKGDWMVKLDLSQAYFHLSIARKHRRFLRMSYEGELLQMTCLPFGLATAPRTFATLTNWIAEYLRSLGIRCVVYLDDFLLAHQSAKRLSEQLAFTIATMKLLGWTLNWEKSVLAPTRRLEFLGITWDTTHNTRSLSEPKCLTLRRALQHQISVGSWSLRQAQSLMGRLNFATFVIRRGRLHCRTLQYYSRHLSSKNPYRKSPIPDAALQEMVWWIKEADGTLPIHLNPITHFLTTDASNIGWGAQLGGTNMAGRWKKDQKDWHVNLKELYAVYAAVTQQSHQLQNAQVLLQTDNLTVVAYINKEGGTRSKKLLQLTRQLLSLLDELNVILTAQYFPGKFNGDVDALSRGKICPEWHLTEVATSMLFYRWGTPQIDLFASATAHVVPSYATLDLRDPRAQFYNAFSRQWTFDLAWLFPPPNIIPQVLAHLNTAMGRYILIAPKWNKVFWRGDLQQRAIREPCAIPNLPDVLIDTVTGKRPPAVESIKLEAWLISGGLT